MRRTTPYALTDAKAAFVRFVHQHLTPNERLQLVTLVEAKHGVERPVGDWATRLNKVVAEQLDLETAEKYLTALRRRKELGQPFVQRSNAPPN